MKISEDIIMNFYCKNTAFGPITIVQKDSRISILKFGEIKYPFEFKETPLIKKTYSELDEYFCGKRKTFDIPLFLDGTDFQKKVWEKLLKIPYGKTKTYKEIAVLIGNENASRAVGGANNKNPIAILVPCHRVIGSNNSLVGYAFGLEAKKRLLKLEKRYDR